MNPGELDRRLSLFEVAESRSDSGEAVVSRNLLRRIPAKRIPARGSRGKADGAETRTTGAAAFVVRWNASLSQPGGLAAYELEESGTRWRITSAIEVGPRRAYLQLDCETINEGAR